MQRCSEMKKNVSPFTRKRQEIYFSCLEITYPLSTLRQLSKQAPFVQLQDVALTKTALKVDQEGS